MGHLFSTVENLGNDLGNKINDFNKSFDNNDNDNNVNDNNDNDNNVNDNNDNDNGNNDNNVNGNNNNNNDNNDNDNGNNDNNDNGNVNDNNDNDNNVNGNNNNNNNNVNDNNDNDNDNDNNNGNNDNNVNSNNGNNIATSNIKYYNTMVKKDEEKKDKKRKKNCFYEIKEGENKPFYHDVSYSGDNSYINDSSFNNMKFKYESNIHVPIISYYCVVLTRLSYFTSDHFLPAYLEIFGKIIPSSIMKTIDNTIPHNLKEINKIEIDNAKKEIDNAEKTENNIQYYEYEGKEYVNFTNYSRKINSITQIRADIAKKYHGNELDPNIKNKREDVHYLSYSTYQYGGVFLLYDLKLPNTIFVIFRGTYSPKSAFSYTKPTTLVPTFLSNILYGTKKVGGLCGMHRLITDIIHSITHGLIYLSKKGTHTKPIRLITTGHSLGGGLSHIFSNYWNEIWYRYSERYNDDTFNFRKTFHPTISCFSVAAPRVFNKNASDKYIERINKDLIVYQRIFVGTDPVKGMPWVPYQHPQIDYKNKDIEAISEKTENNNDNVTLTPEQEQIEEYFNKNLYLNINTTRDSKLGFNKSICYNKPLKAYNMPREDKRVQGVQFIHHVEYMYIDYFTAVSPATFAITAIPLLTPSIEIKDYYDRNKKVNRSLCRILEGSFSKGKESYKHVYYPLGLYREAFWRKSAFRGCNNIQLICGRDVKMDQNHFDEIMKNMTDIKMDQKKPSVNIINYKNADKDSKHFIEKKIKLLTTLKEHQRLKEKEYKKIEIENISDKEKEVEKELKKTEKEEEKEKLQIEKEVLAKLKDEKLEEKIKTSDPYKTFGKSIIDDINTLDNDKQLMYIIQKINDVQEEDNNKVQEGDNNELDRLEQIKTKEVKLEFIQKKKKDIMKKIENDHKNEFGTFKKADDDKKSNKIEKKINEIITTKLSDEYKNIKETFKETYKNILWKILNHNKIEEKELENINTNENNIIDGAFHDIELEEVFEMIENVDGGYEGLSRQLQSQSGGLRKTYEKDVSKWYHIRPKAYYTKCIELFGKPTFVSNVKDGYALWKTKGLFTKHLLIDEDIKHCVPRHHHDYFYSSIRFFVPKHKLCDVLKISGSLQYDGLKKELTARCGGINANYATLYLAMLVAIGKLTIQEVKSHNMYPKMIRGEIVPHHKMAKKMMELKRSHQNKYRKETKANFATYAYKKCYNKKTKRNKKLKNVKKTLKKMKNTRNIVCGKTNCCPHMPLDKKGRYRATNEKSILKYKGKTYELHTCCLMCSKAMNELVKKDIKTFEKQYKPHVEKRVLYLSNKHTKKRMQELKEVS